ncbi:MAG TPA: thioesterase family protein [Shinella sp.]|uniref:acyl-CoA thioesterase n=1 Tax=Shinella sp. TaxID=1870904 RepID=UPI002E138A63|nr:thioesterase family protein [Shinella sp.]
MEQTADITVSEVRIPFRDIDMHGHMHNAAYYAHAEAAVASLWRHRPEGGNGPVYFVRKSGCTFHRGLRLDDLARFKVSVTRIGATSLSFAVAISSDGAAVADLEIVWVAVDPATRQPVNVPQPMRDWLKSFLA